MTYKLLRSSVFCALIFAGVFSSASNAQVAHYGSETVIVSDSNVNAQLEGVAADSSGNIYVADAGTNTVFKYTLSGGTYTQSVVANTGLKLPVAVVVDSNFNVYISDEDNSRVLKETPSGGVYTQSVVTTSGLTFPSGVAVDSSGNVYVCDYANNRVLKETLQSGGTYVQTVISTGANSSPIAIAIDSNGNLYINDSGNGTVLLETYSAGSYTQSTIAINSAYLNQFEGVAVDGNGNIYVANSGGSGTGANTVLEARLSGGAYYPSVIGSGFEQPWGLGTDNNGNIYVTNFFNQVIKLSYPTTNFGTVNVGTTASAFTLPFTIGANSTTLLAGGAVFLGASGTEYLDAGTGTCDTNGTSHSYSAGNTCTVNVTFDPKAPGTRNGAVELVSTSNDVVATGYITGTGSAPQIAFPPGVQSTIGTSLGVTPGVAVDGKGNVFITDSTNKDLVKETFSAGSYTQSVIASGYTSPAGTAVDGAGNIYITDASGDFVGEETVYSPTIYQGSFIVLSGLSGPQGVAVDSNGNVYFADAGHNRVLEEVLNSLPNYDTIAYFQIVVASGLSNPEGVAVDSSGNVFIADTGNNRVLKETVTSSGNFTQSVVVGSGLSGPEGVAVDDVGDLYIADSGDKRVLKETPFGPNYTQSVVPLTGLGNPEGVALDASGNLYVADSTNHDVVKYVPSNLPSVSFATPTAVGSADTTDDPKTVTIENIGNAFLNFSSFAASTNFTVDPGSTTCLTLSPLPVGQSCVVGVDFVPTATGPLAGTLTLTDNNLNVTGSTQVISLSGTGTAIVPPAQAATPVISPAGGAYNAPVAVQITDSSASPTIYYTTTGTAPVVPSSPTYSGVFTVSTSGTEVEAVATASGDSTSNQATPATYTVQPVIVFNPAAVGISAGSAQQLTATFSLAGTTAPTASLHYGHDYALGTLSCTPNVGIETCSVAITFVPTLPGTRKDALFLTSTGTRVATVLLNGVGQAPLALMQPGVITQAINNAGNALFASVVDENGTAYILESSFNEIFMLTKAGVQTTLPMTGLSSPRTISIDGAGVLYVHNGASDSAVLTYDTVQAIQGSKPLPSNHFWATSVGNAGNLYAVDENDGVFYVIKPDGTTTSTTLNPTIAGPSQLAVDSSEDVFIGGATTNEITAGGTQTGFSNTDAINAVLVDAAGTLYAGPYAGYGGLPELPATNYNGTPIADIDSTVPLTIGGGLGSDGTVFVGTQVGLDKVDRSHGAVSFGAQTANVASTAQTVSLYNGGNQNLTLSSLALSGSASGFALQTAATSPCTNGMTIVPGALCKVSVTLTAPGAGTFSGSISFTTNTLNSANTIQQVSLTGFVNGINVTASPNPLNFANQLAGTSSAAQSVTLTNNGTSATATISTPLPAESGYTLGIGTCNTPIAANGGTCQLSVTFSPTLVQAYDDLVTLSALSNGGGPSPQAVPFNINGLGTSPAPPAATPVISPVGGTYNAAVAVQITDSSASPTIYYTTTGTAPVVPSSPTYSGVFTVSTSGTEVEAVATASGDSTSNQATPATYTVNPVIAFNPAAVGISAGSAQQLTATVSLAGATAPTAVLHYGHDYSVGAVSCTPNVGIEVCTVPITFIPTLPGGRKDALFLMNGSARVATVLLGGVGNAPLSMVQPGVVTNPIVNNTNYLYNSTVDENGTVYVLGDNSNTVYSVTKAGVVSTLPIPATPGNNPTGLSNPSGIAIDGAGVLYIAQNTYSHTLLTYDTVQNIVGTLCVAPPSLSLSCTSGVNNEYLYSVANDALGNLFVLDILSPQDVFELTPSGSYALSPAVGNPGPTLVAVDTNDDIFLAGGDMPGTGNPAIEEIVGGAQTSVNSTGGVGEGMAIDAAGTIYGTRYSVPPYDVVMLPASNYQTPLAGIDGGTSGEIESPLGLGLGSDGTLFVGNYGDLDKVDRTQGSIAFGSQSMNVASAAQTVGIYNGGNQNLTLASFAVSGAGYVMVPAATNGCSTNLVIAPGKLCNVNVTANFPHAGTFPGTVTFTTNSLNTTSTTQTVTLSGSVNGPYVTGTPAAFGNWNIGTQPTIQVPLTNSGTLFNAELNLSLATLPAGFTISGGPPLISNTCAFAGETIAPGASCLVTVTFSPTAGVSYGGAISIPVSSSGGGGPWPAATIAASGTGLSSQPSASLSPNPVTFTGQIVGTTSQIMAVQLSNSDVAQLTGIAPTITGTNLSDFAIVSGSGSCGSTLAAGSSCSIYVTFTPASATSFTATLSVADNGSNTPQTATLNGTGVAFTSNVGTAEAAQMVTVPITTAGTLSNIQVLTQGIPSLDFTTTIGGTCATATAYTVGQTCTVNVVFTPQYAGARDGALVLYGASGNEMGIAYLPGTGTGPQVVFSPGVFSTIPAPPPGTPYYTQTNVAIDGNKDIYEAYGGWNLVYKVPWTGSSYGTPVAVPVTGLNTPLGIAVDAAGDLFIVNQGSNQLLELPWTGSGFGAQVTLTTSVHAPTCMTVDANGNIFVGDNLPEVVEIPWTGTGYGAQITVPTTGLDNPTGVSTDANGNVYIVDSNDQRVIEVARTASGFGAQTTLPFTGLSYPISIVVGPTGNVYVGETSAIEVYELPWTGTTYGAQQTLLRNPLNAPYGLVLDGAGNIYMGYENGNGGAYYGVEKLDLADPPTLSFATSTNVGSQDTTDGPKTTTAMNVGNASLIFTQDVDPVYPTDFPVNNSDTSLCTSSGSLKEGAGCDVSVNFKPTTGGPLSENVVLTDNNLNGSNVTQSIAVSGAGVSALTAQAITFTQPTTPITYSSGLTIPLVAAGGASGNPVVFTIDAISTTGAGSISGSTLTVNTPGTIVIDANQAGNSTYSAAPQVQRTLVVGQASQAISFTQPTTPVTYSGTSVIVPLSATGGASGNPVVFTIDGSSTGTGSISSSTLTVTSVGNFVIDANQTGNTDYSAATQVQRTILVNSPNSQAINFTQPATPVTYTSGLTIPLVASGGGSENPVVFSIDTSSTGAGSISGGTVTVTSVGSFVIDANQAGNSTYSAAPQVQRTVVVTQAPQAINFTQPATPVTYSSGLSITLSATGGASGSAVVFSIDASSTAKGTISGSTLTVTSAGNLVIDANQAGNTDYSAAAQVQRTVVVNVPAPDFSVAATPPSQSVAPGGSAMYPITVADVGSAFTGTVTLSVSGLPTGATGSFTPASVTPGSEGGSSTLTVSLPATASAVRPNLWPMATPVLALLFMLPFRRWRKVWRGRLLLLIAGVASLGCAASLTGCGGGFGFTQSQTYTLTITGTSGTDTHSTTVQLTVQQ